MVAAVMPAPPALPVEEPLSTVPPLHLADAARTGESEAERRQGEDEAGEE